VRIDLGGRARTVRGVRWSACVSPRACGGGTITGGRRYAIRGPAKVLGVRAPTSASTYRTAWQGSGRGRSGSRAFRLGLPVADGPYRVRLHAIEPTQRRAGRRVFGVDLEGGRVDLRRLDPFRSARGRGRVTVRTLTVTVRDGRLDLTVLRRTGTPLLSAVEVLPA
jgi:hypothetical protein